MQAFVRIAKRGSFSQAADDLNIPRATITNLIKRLELRLAPRADTRVFVARTLISIASSFTITNFNDWQSFAFKSNPKRLLMSRPRCRKEDIPPYANARKYRSARALSTEPQDSRDL